MKALKIILGAVYVVLIILLFLFSCKGCHKEEPAKEEEEVTDTIQPQEPEPDPEPEPQPADQEIIDEADSHGEKGDLKITLLWDYQADMDLHVIEPDGTHIYFNHARSISGGYLDVDNTHGGPGAGENIYWDNPPSGIYQVYVHYYSASGPVPSECKVVVQQRGREPVVYPVQFTAPRQEQGVVRVTVE